MKRPDRFLRKSNQQGRFPFTDLRLTQITMKPARSDDGQARLVALREPNKGAILQSQTQEELGGLLPSVLDRAFKGEL